MGAVDQAVGEALTYYLEEHPKEAKLIVDKVILAAQARICLLYTSGAAACLQCSSQTGRHIR